MDSPEWEITLYLHEFDESWMRYALGRGSDQIIRKSLFIKISNSICRILFAEKSVKL